MDWLENEPALDEVLSDPIVGAVMARDGVEAENLRSFLSDVGRALQENPGDGPTLRRHRG